MPGSFLYHFERQIMKTTTLNQTGRNISSIGLGAMPLSISGRPPESRAIDVIHRALDLGITLIDTADSYCRNESDKHHNEKLIQKALDQYPEDTSEITIATKGGLMRPDGDWTRNGDPGHLYRTIRQSHQALGGDRPIPLWQFHAPDPEWDISSSLEPAADAVEEGLIEHVGVSNFNVEEIREARNVVDVVSVQNEYSPWHREPEQDGVLSYCEEEGLTFFPYSPFGGMSRAKDLDQIDIIDRIASRKKISPHRVVIAWLRQKSDCIVPIPGASRKESIEDTSGGTEVELTDNEFHRINEKTGN